MIRLVSSLFKPLNYKNKSFGLGFYNIKKYTIFAPNLIRNYLRGLKSPLFIA